MTGPAAGVLVSPIWMTEALCVESDPELWWPADGGSTAPAKRICQVCPVITECALYAMTHDERGGIWGGLSDRERRSLRRAS